MTPAAVAIQVGQGSWSSITPASQIQIPLQGGGDYGVAFTCANVPLLQLDQLTAAADPSVTLICPNGFSSPATVKINVSYTASLSGAQSATLWWRGGSQSLPASCSSCSASIPSGTQDLVLTVQSSSGAIIGLSEAANQDITQGASVNLPSPQPLGSSQVSFSLPSGFQGTLDTYWVTPNGTFASLLASPLPLASSPASLPAAPSGNSGTQEVVGSAFSVSSSSQELIASAEPLASSLAFPPPFGPQVTQSSGAFPTFSGLNASGASFYSFSVSWGSGSAQEAYAATVLPAWLSQPSYTLPNLSGLPGFSAFQPPASAHYAALVFYGSLSPAQSLLLTPAPGAGMALSPAALGSLRLQAAALFGSY